jgi:hypothetical protein
MEFRLHHRGGLVPGHFTHIYTQRRVAEWLAAQKVFNPDDHVAGRRAPVQGLAGGFLGIDPQRASELMKQWPTFAAVGAIGPDLFFFSMDYSSGPLAEFPFEDDLVMLAMRVAYWVDTARDEDWAPLLALLAEVNHTFANIVRLLLKLQALWDKFIEVWDATVGPIVSSITSTLDDLSGGVISAAGGALDELVAGIEQVVIEELVTFTDIFSWFSLKMRVGWDEQAFVWSDMLHYRKTNQMARALLEEAERQFELNGDETQFAQFQAFALGWICHVGTDVVAHSFVNEQCGGPFRTHWQRHHLIENHIDAWNYRQAGTVQGQRGTLPEDPIGATDTYTDADGSALAFAVALDPAHDNQHNSDAAGQYGWTQTPDGWARPDPLPDDPADQKGAVDIDGDLPDWLAEGIVRALIATYHDGGPEPKNLGGSAFQATAPDVLSKLGALLDGAGISVGEPLKEFVEQIAPDPDFDVPAGYPLPWEVQVSYRFMITYYKLAFRSSFNLDKPRRPDVIMWPPASDFTNLASVPDLSGVSGSDPVEDVCDAIAAIVAWFAKEAAAMADLVGDITKALLSPGTYPIRWALYQLAMWAWDMTTTTHDILAHTGFMIPHGALTYPDGDEIRWTNEIDQGMIALGHSIDGAFAQALQDAIDPLAHLDGDPALLIPADNPRAAPYPFLPVRTEQSAAGDVNEYSRPWAYPNLSKSSPHVHYPTPGELSNVVKELDAVGLGDDLRAILAAGVAASAGTVSGPYPRGATPDEVLFRTGRPIDPQVRQMYETAATPAHTDALNEQHIGRLPDTDAGPLGDPIQLCGYLMGRALDPELIYDVDFNLDADRGYGYRCWDWIRGTDTGTDHRGDTYLLPVAAPEGAEASTFDPAPPEEWAGPLAPMQLRYLSGEGRQDGQLQ